MTVWGRNMLPQWSYNIYCLCCKQYFVLLYIQYNGVTDANMVLLSLLFPKIKSWPKLKSSVEKAAPFLVTIPLSQWVTQIFTYANVSSYSI